MRTPKTSALLALLVLAGEASGHDEDPGGNPGDAHYYAFIDDFHANPSTTDGTGEVFLTLNPQHTELSYRIVLSDLLGLKPRAEDRTEPDDILGMHLHLHVPDTIGPHVLNIFGLATVGVRGEEDADLVVDYEHHTLTGIFDLSDASRDPVTGDILPQFFFATSKVLGDWLDELEAGDLVLAVHTVESGFANFAIHGHIHPVSLETPEPASGFLFLAGLFLMGLFARRRVCLVAN